MKGRTGLLVAAMALSGCETDRQYLGLEHPLSEQATIVGDSKFGSALPIRAVIRKVDERVVALGYSKVAVLPGHHDVLVDCVMANQSTVRFPLEIEAFAGHRYVLRPESSAGNRRCSAVHVDEQ